MKKNPVIILLLLGVVAMVTAGAFAGNDELRKKARYYYLEGARRQAEGNNIAAYEYFKKAYSLDPSYDEAASAYGMTRLMVKTDTLQSETELLRSLEYMRQFVDKYPGDKNESLSYAYVAGRLDTISEAIRIYERLDSIYPTVDMTLLQLAEAYMADHQGKKAINALDRYENAQGKSPQVSLKKMSYMLSLGDTTGAVDEATALIEYNPNEPTFRILKGNLYEVIGNNDSTLAYFHQAEEMNPGNGTVKMALANYYKNIGDSVEFDNKMYEALLSEDFMLEEKVSFLEEYLQSLLNDKSDTGRGDHLFSVLMEQYPHEPVVLDLAARYSGAKGDYKDAEEQIGYAIDLDPNNVSYWGQLMQYQLADERGADAMKTYHRAAAHIEVPNGLKLMYASAATTEKNFEEAEKAYAELIHEANPDLPLTDSISDTKFRGSLNFDGLTRLCSLYTMLGDMYYTAGEIDKTFKAYDNALFFYASSPLTLNNYAYFLTETDGDLDKAFKMSKEALDQDPENETYLDTYAWVLFKRKDYKEALEYQKQAVETAELAGEPAAEYYHHLGDIYFMNHQPEEALKNWERALELEPENELLKKKVAHKTFFFK